MSQKKSYDKNFKILILGDSSVGKTCLLLRYTENKFANHYFTTIGLDCKFKSLKIDDKLIGLSIYDTAGQERFRTITKSYYHGCHGIILVYDIENPDTFNSISTWIEQIKPNIDKNVTKILIGNKCDSTNRKVVFDEGKKLSQEFNMIFFETSALTGENVNEVFECMVRDLLNKNVEGFNKDNIMLTNDNKKKKKKCC